MGTKRRSYNLDENLLKALKLSSTIGSDDFDTVEKVVSHALHVAMQQLATQDPHMMIKYKDNLDPRLNQPCFGGLCLGCKYARQCKRGLYKDGFVANY